MQRQPPCDHPEVLGRELLWLGFPTLASSLFSDALASVEPLSCLAPAPPPQRTEDDLGVAWDARTHRRILSLLGRAGCSSVFAAVHSPPSAAAALPDVISALTLCSTSVCYLSLKVVRFVAFSLHVFIVYTCARRQECLVVLAALICALGQPKMSSDILSSVMPRLMENGPPDLRCRALLTSATCEVSAGAPPPPRRLQRALNFAQRAIADAEQANEPSLLREAVHMAVGSSCPYFSWAALSSVSSHPPCRRSCITLFL